MMILSLTLISVNLMSFFIELNPLRNFKTIKKCMSGQSHIDSSDAQHHMDIKILAQPPNHINLKLSFSEKINKILFCYSRIVYSVKVLQLQPFSSSLKL